VLDEKPRSRSVNHKPAATKQEVIAVMIDVLSANASLDGLQYALGDLKADATPSAQLKPRPKSALPPEKP